MFERPKMLNGIREIGKLNVSGECLMGLNARRVGLENRIALSDEITNAKINESKWRNGEEERKASNEIPSYAIVTWGVTGESL